MGRLVSAVLILFAVLVGLRFSTSLPFQRNVAANRLDTAAQDTRNTGFTADSTGAVPGTGVPSQSASTQTLSTSNPGVVSPTAAAGTTPLPPASPSAIPGSW